MTAPTPHDPWSRLRAPRGRLLLSAAVATVALCAGCVVGPDFKRPEAPATDRFTAEPLPASTRNADSPAGTAQTFAPGAEVMANWWTLYRCPALDALVNQALAANPSVLAGQAALRQAHENVLAAWGALVPAVDGSASGARQRVSGAQFGPAGQPALYNLYNASVSVSYALDIFGGTRRELEGLRAQSAYERFVLEATYLTLTANVVTTAVTEASLRAQILATEQLIASSSKRLSVIQAQKRLGGASGADVLAQQAELAQDQAALPALRNQLARQRTLLATLIGRLPSEQPDAAFQLSDLELPESIPVSLPSQLVTQRPDVRQQEELLHQASAAVGIATANMLPKITLSASWGGSSESASTLFSGPNRAWSASAGLAQPLLHGGELLHRRRAAVAAYDQAAAQYRETVLGAFRNVADSLRALTADADGLAAEQHAEDAAAASLAMADRQYKLGAVSYLTLLNAQRSEQQTRIALIQAQAARLADTAALFQALGGGWWNRDTEIARRVD